MECPKCRSTDFKRLSIIVDEGTYTGISESTGVSNGNTRGTVGGRVLSASHSGTVSSTTTTTTVSNLASKVAPPYKYSPAKTILWGIGFGFGTLLVIQLICVSIFGNTTGNLIGFIINIIPASLIMKTHIKTAIEEHRFNKYEYPLLYRRWEQSFHCNRCGEVFEEETRT